MLTRRESAAQRLLVDQQPVYAKLLSDAKASHAAEQAAEEAAHNEADVLRARLRDIDRTEDTDLAASVLEVDLSNQDIPLPIEFHIHFDGLHEVMLEIDLPGYADVPETKTQLTQTGKLSERPMAVRDRSSLYRDVCAGIALRLVYETYRVLPFVEKVTARGLAERPIHAANEPRYLGLRVVTTREAFAGYDLDVASPAALCLALGGEISSVRDGTLKPLSGNDG